MVALAVDISALVGCGIKNKIEHIRGIQ